MNGQFSEELRLHLHDSINDKKLRAQEDVVEDAIANGYEEDTVRNAMAYLFEQGALKEAPVELLIGKVKDFDVVEGAIDLVLLPKNDGL